MPHLTHLELHHASYWPSSQTLTLATLRKLCCPVQHFSRDGVSRFMLALNAPSLEEMTAGCIGKFDGELALSACSKFPLLTRLFWVLGDIQSTGIASIQLLSEAFPFLTEITWIAKFYPRLHMLLDSMQKLHNDNDNTIDIVALWPRLETMGMMTLDAKMGDSLVADLQQFLIRRYQIGYPIRTLCSPKADIIVKGRVSPGAYHLVVVAEFVDYASPFPDVLTLIADIHPCRLVNHPTWRSGVSILGCQPCI